MNREMGLERFVLAQQNCYQTALEEIRSGLKRSHWMWFIFPQLKGLGRSTMSNYYGIDGMDEAVLYLGHPLLGARLREICSALVLVEGRSSLEIFGSVDNAKLRSSMTLFAHATAENRVFLDVLDKYFDGKYDQKTLRLLGGDL